MEAKAELYLNESLEKMKSMPDEIVDIVLTDPPYVLNLKSVTDYRKYRMSAWADMVNPAIWYMAWLQECRRLLKADGCLWTFLNWRSLVTFQKAASDIVWPIESLLVWDKQWIGLGGNKGLRPSYEMVALFLKGDYLLPNRSLPDIWRFQGSSNKPHGHPTEKPEGLMEMILKESPGQVVMDPFMGSGTTGAAAVKLGRDFIGMESDPNYFETARQRIESCQRS